MRDAPRPEFGSVRACALRAEFGDGNEARVLEKRYRFAWSQLECAGARLLDP